MPQNMLKHVHCTIRMVQNTIKELVKKAAPKEATYCAFQEGQLQKTNTMTSPPQINPISADKPIKSTRRPAKGTATIPSAATI